MPVLSIGDSKGLHKVCFSWRIFHAVNKKVKAIQATNRDIRNSWPRTPQERPLLAAFSEV